MISFLRDTMGLRVEFNEADGQRHDRSRVSHVSKRVGYVRYSEHVDFGQPVEALIPGASGRVLGALARVEAELSVSGVAAVAGIGRTRASAVLNTLAQLGVVSRRQVGPTVLVRLERRNTAGKLIAELADLRNSVIGRLRQLALSVDPPPLSMALFGSFARGDSDSASDIDILAVRPLSGGGERWAASLTEFAAEARVLTGNSVQILDYELSDLKRRYGAREDDAGAAFWRSVTEDALPLAGADLSELIGGGNAAR